jgi:hypothetical protein
MSHTAKNPVPALSEGDYRPADGSQTSEVASLNSDSTSVGAPTFLWLECAQHAQQSIHPEETAMARKYSRGAQRKVKKVMKERKRGTLKSGRSGKKVKKRKQAIAIGLAEARRAGKKVPKMKSTGGSH